MIDRLHLGRRHAPALRGGGFEHGAGRSADLAHRHQIVPRAARSVGILVAELGLVAMRLLDPNARPVGFHLFGDDHRQAGADTGSHLGAVRDDRNRSVGCDGNENARVDHGTVRHLVRAGLVGGKAGRDITGAASTKPPARPRPFRMLRRETFSTLMWRSKPRSLLGLVMMFMIRPPSMRDGPRFRCVDSSRNGRCCPPSLRVSGREWALDFRSGVLRPA